VSDHSGIILPLLIRLLSMASFLSSSAQNSSDPSPSNRTPADLARWQNRIQEVQSSRVTPEIRQRIQETASRKQRTMKVAKKAKRLETANYLSSTTNMTSLRGLSAASVPSPFASTSAITAARQTEEDYLENSTRTKKWSSAIQNSVRSPQALNDEEEEALDRNLEAISAELEIETRRQSELTPHVPSPQISIQSAQAYGQMTHSDRIQQQSTVNSELDSLLMQFHSEPTNDVELLAKFTLYETFLETVITLREETMRFWSENKDLFDPSSRQLAQNEITHIDRPETMGILVDDAYARGRWFVYDMTKKVNENNKLIGKILANLRTRLEMLSSEEDLGECPFCLDDLTSMAKDPEGNKTMVLTCCHRVCRECWENWVEIKGPTAFCPLCRHEEFVQDILL
jgi:hypothetical protein